jgi:hypothetical protein
MMCHFVQYETGPDGITGCLAQQLEAGKILLEELAFLFSYFEYPRLEISFGCPLL